MPPQKRGPCCAHTNFFWPSPPPPPVRRRVVCWSQGASTRRHKKLLVSGTTGAFWLCSDERTSRCTSREHSVRLTPRLSQYGTPHPPLGRAKPEACLRSIAPHAPRWSVWRRLLRRPSRPFGGGKGRVETPSQGRCPLMWKCIVPQHHVAGTHSTSKGQRHTHNTQTRTPPPSPPPPPASHRRWASPPAEGKGPREGQ